MFRESLLGIFLLSVCAPLLFGQQYYPSAEAFSTAQIAASYAVPAPGVAVPYESCAAHGPSNVSPYAAPYDSRYVISCPAPYPAATAGTSTPVPTVPYPVLYPATLPYPASPAASYATPSPVQPVSPYGGGVSYEVSPNMYAPAPYGSTCTVPYPMPSTAPYAAPYGAGAGGAPGASAAVPFAPAYPSTETLPETPDPVSPPLPAASATGETAAGEKTAEPGPAAEGKKTEGNEETGDKEAGGTPEGGTEGEEPALPEEEIPTAWYYVPFQWIDPWEGNVEIGLSGSEGNTQTLNYLLGLDAKRETDEDIVNFDVKYDRKSADSVETAHRLFSEIRWELLFQESPWTWFFHQTTEYDEFKAFNVRLSYDTGLGRRLIKTEETSLLARVGGGASHEIGGSNEDLVPEAVFGLEFTHELNERQKLSASSEYSPDVTDFLDYRMKWKASWEVVLDEETNLSLKISILDRYDSTPDGKRPNDLDYTLTLLWSF